MLEIRELAKRYDGKPPIDAVQNLTFELEKGRFLAIVGRSGSGKSTLLAMLGGISRPSSGSVLIDGCNQWNLNDDAHADFRNLKIGYVFQFASLLPTLRAIDNVALPAIIGGTLDETQAYARAHALLDRIGLARRFDFYPGQLSGGEQRRVAIARALINSPDLLLADEPTADLDEETEEEILNLLVDIHRSFNLTMIVVTHNLAIAERADQVLEMRAGRAVQSESRVPALAGAISIAARTNQNRGESGGSTPFTNAPAVARQTSDPDPDKSNIDSSTGTEAPPQTVEEIFNPEELTEEPVLLGAGLERFVGRFIIWAMPILLAIYGINSLVAGYEKNAIAAKIAEQQSLEELAMRDLRAEIQDVTMGPGNTYKVSIYLTNVTDERPIYVMSPTVRAFVQVGPSWQEVSMTPTDSSPSQVQKIEGTKLYNFTLEPSVSEFAQLLPYYMHVRLSNDMLISPSDHPKSDLIERNDNYYIYLKPHNADNAAILRKLKFPGEPPVYIPMPPH